ncbi:MAG: diphthine--ammonia ligase [Pyrinomonadaceae bacterium]
MKDVLMSWSGGKDSCLALYEIQKSHDYRVTALLTTMTRDYDRISMHGVRRILLEQQAASVGIPLHQVLITKGVGNQEYETNLIEAVSAYRHQGIDSIVFGDLFLEDIKTYRDHFLARHNLQGIYPVWLRDTTEFIQEFIRLGFKAVVTCVNVEVLDPSFAGMMIDESFLAALPLRVDPCGENGEFHTFVFDGPNFKSAVEFSLGEIVQRDGFWFCDLLPTHTPDRFRSVRGWNYVVL